MGTARIVPPISTRTVDRDLVSGFVDRVLPDFRVVDTVAVIVTTFGGAVSATLGVLVGGVVTRRVQERHWLRDKQLQAYEELF